MTARKDASNSNGSPNGLQQAPNGVLIIDKPADMTSADVVKRIKRLPGVKKAGHTGTLDPFATGVLVCPINRATRLAQFFLHSRKTYAATMHLGIETDTQDHTGRTVATHAIENIDEPAISVAVDGFIGQIEQVPPVFSALKHEGVPLYKHARNGRPVEKPPRRVHIGRIDLVGVRLPEIDIEVSCSGGTYIRTLCADIGRRLGCGAHLCRLRRTETGGKTLAEAVSLSELQAVESMGRLKWKLICKYRN
ncbi:MAG: tRNA pseudouridine(55) synthase TruB, partial [Thermodesulfobacteriota bacterium]